MLSVKSLSILELNKMNDRDKTKFQLIDDLGRLRHRIDKLEILETKHKQMEEELRKSEERYRIITETVLAGITIVDADENLTFANPAFAEMTGYSHDELMGMRLSQLTDQEEFAMYQEQTRERKKGMCSHYETKIRCKDGRIQNVLVSASPFTKADGSYEGSLVVTIDITKLKQVEEALQKGYDELEHRVEERTIWLKTINKLLKEQLTERKKMEVKLRNSQHMEVLGQLTAGVSHEVRNPLSAILAVSEALKKDLGENSEYSSYLDQIITQVDRLSHLMKDLLDLGKPIVQSRLQPESMLVIITQTIELWKQSTSFKKHKIHFIKPAGIGKLEVIADGAKLQQVFLNLLENAAQHSSEDNEIQLVILEPEGKTLGVCVVDCGSGIPPENLPRIFEPFFSTRRKGTGLGLSIVKNIVETHGGEITVRNNDESPGCTVEVSLPIAEDLES